MNIIYDEESQIFHLYNDEISYVLGILKNGHLGHFHFGARLYGPLVAEYFRADQNKGLTPYTQEGDFGFSLNLERQEYPVFGTSDFRDPALGMTLASGSQLLDFRVVSHTIEAGKPSINALPSTWVSVESDAKTLCILLIDPVTQVELSLSYTIFKSLPVISRHTELINKGATPVKLHKIMSLSLDLMDSGWEWLQFSGDWIRERQLHSRLLKPGLQSISSRRGASSAQHNPFLILKRPDTNEMQGEAIGLLLVYSSNFIISAEVDPNGQTRLMTGINPDGFSWTLDPNCTFESPEALISYSNTGLEHLSHSFHALMNTHLIPTKWQTTPRPVLINSWEAAYFDFNEEKLLALAKEASDVGIELFVLDDGWFENRNDDTCGLGDWRVNTTKLPHGIKRLAEKVNALGLQFGLWIEPEMVNKGTALFETHPDWVIGDPARTLCHARNQYILDFSRPEVVDHIYDQLILILDDAPIAYLKWDMNRNMTDLYSHGLSADRQQELSHRYIKGVYALYHKLTTRYPHLLIESCSAGGGRFDPGMLYYAPQAWTSDNTDAASRLKIQYGTSFAYPLSSMGSHVSASPNHQVLRATPLKTRANVAYFGTFGYELNLTQLSDHEKEMIKEQISFFKTHRSLIHTGDFYRLLSPFEGDGNQTAWMVVSNDKNKALVGWYQNLATPNLGLTTLRLRGLDPQSFYTIDSAEQHLSGSLLMHFGLLMKPSFNGIHLTGEATGDHQSRIYVLQSVGGTVVGQ